MNIKVHDEGLKRINGWEQPIHCLKCHITSLDAARRYNMHYHDYIEFLYGFSGNAQVMIADQRYPMQKGDLVVINAGKAHEVYCEEGEAEYYVVKFLPDLLYAQGKSLLAIRYLLSVWQDGIGANPRLPSETIKDSGIGDCIDRIRDENAQKEPGYELIQYAGIMQIFVWILRNCCSIDDIAANIPSHAKEALENVLAEAPKHLYDEWSTADAAQFCHFSYSYFSRIFKRAFGMSYSAYAEALRLREAERLLLTTDREITDIASALGFSSTSYFTNRFRLRYGAPPHRFRRRTL